MQFPSHPNCKECSLCADAKSVGISTVVYYEGELGGPAVVFIAQNPGAQEDEANEPFIGRSGSKLKEGYVGPLIASHPERTIYLTNAVRCHTTGNKKPPASTEKCFGLHTMPDLFDIVDAHDRIAIVLTGATAVASAGRAGLIEKLSLTAAMRSQPISHIMGDHTGVFATFHPAAVMRDTSLAAPVGDHLGLIDAWLRDDMPQPIHPTRIEPRAPLPSDSRLGSLDIETHGAVQSCPPQSCFIAPLALHRDGITPRDLVQTLALTLYTEEEDPCTPTTPEKSKTSLSEPLKKTVPITQQEQPASVGPSSTAAASSPWPPSSQQNSRTKTTERTTGKMTPGLTMVFNLQRPDQRIILYQWVCHLNSFLGMNLLFDLTWLRSSSILLRQLLDGRHTLRDVSVLNVLDNEARPERGLDDIGQIVGAVHIPKPLKGGFRFKDAADPALANYNAADSHATVVIADTLLTRLDARGTLQCHAKNTGIPVGSQDSCLREGGRRGLGEGSQGKVDVDDGISGQRPSVSSKMDAGRANFAAPPDIETAAGSGGGSHQRECVGQSTVESENHRLQREQLQQDSIAKEQHVGAQRSKPRQNVGVVDSVRKIEGSVPTEEMPYQGRCDSRCQRLPFHAYSGGFAEVFYSDLIHSTIRMQESGVPFSRRKLLEVQRKAQARVARCNSISPVSLSGKGSGAAAKVVLQNAYELVAARGYNIEDHHIEEHPCFERTPITHDISTSKLSRRLFIELLQARVGVCGSSGELRMQDGVQGTSRQVVRQLRLMQRHQEARDIISRYTKKLLKLGVPRGRDTLLVFPSWHMTPSPFKDKQGAEGGTRNSRFAASNPPIQQIGAANVKPCIQSRHYGGSIVWFDLGQAELRVLAMESGDPYLLRAFRDGLDLHTELAVAVEGPRVVENPWFKTGHPTKDPRQTYKKANFLCTYGGGPKVLIQSLFKDGGPLLSFAAARRIIDTIRTQRRVAVAWQTALVTRVLKTGWLELPFTRQCRHFSVARDKHGRPIDERAMLNFPTQAESSNVICRMMNVWRILPPGVHMFLNMHDGLAWDCPPDTGPATIEAIHKTAHWVETEDIWAMMQTHYGNEVPLRYDVYEVPND